MERIKKYTGKFQEKIKALGPARATKWALLAAARKTKHKLFRVPKHIALEGNLWPDSIDETSMIAKDGRKVFIFSLIPFYDIGGGQRPAQLAKTFNKMGYAVYYIFGMNSSESKLFHLEVPTIVHRNVDGYAATEFANTIEKDDLVIFEFPYYKFIPYLDIAKEQGAKIIYENIDNWETSLSCDFFERTALKNVLRKADILVGTAKPLVQQLQNYLREYKIPAKEVLYLPNAVDTDIFEPRIQYQKPSDLITGKKTLVYYGSLWGEWFDWDLVFGVANEFPEYSIILIGDKSPVSDYVRRSPKNVHFLGLKKQSDLPAYLAYCDVAIIPFKVCEIGEYVSPLKIFEYIAMNKVVISTRLPDIAGYPNTHTGNSVSDWVSILKKKKTFGIDHTSRNEFISENTWLSRCAGMIDVTYPNSAKKCREPFYDNISIIILNYNNDKVIFDCVDSLLSYNDRYNYEIIVVDNRSTDGSYEKLRNNYRDKIKLLRNSKNGCSSGRNLGIKNAKKDYIMFLDSDQFALHKYWLDTFLDLMSRKNVDVVGWAAGWLKKEFDGFSRTVFDYPYNYMPANALARRDVDYLGSGGMITKKRTLDKINGFDEEYDPTCFEDTDISFALRHAGFSIYYSPYLGAFHLAHQTTESGSVSHQRLFDKNQEYFHNKWRSIDSGLLTDTRNTE